MRIVKTKHFPVWHNHPGGYQYILAFLLFMFKPIISAVLMPRLFNFILGMFTIYFYFLLSRKLFGKTTAIVSSVILSLSIQHIMLSINTLSYGPMYFGLIAGLYYFISYLGSNKNKQFVLSMIFIAFASMMRQEAWLIIPVLALVLLLRKKLIRLIWFIILTSSFPVYYMTKLFFMYKNPFEFYYVGGGFDSLVNYFDWKMFLTFTKYLIANYPLFLFVAGLLGMLLCFKHIKKYKHKYLMIAFFVLNYIFYQIMVMSHNFIFISSYGDEYTRYSVIFIIFLIPFTVDFFNKSFTKITKNKIVATVLITLLMIPFLTVTYNNYSKYKQTKFIPPGEYYELRDFLVNNIPEDTKLYIATDLPQRISFAVTESNNAYQLSYFITPEIFNQLNNFNAKSLYEIAEDHIKEDTYSGDYILIIDQAVTRLINMEQYEQYYDDTKFEKTKINRVLILKPVKE